MRIAILTLMLFYAIGVHGLLGQDLVFTNTKSDGVYPKFVIQDGKTTLSVKGLMATTKQTWNQVPVNFDNTDGRSRHKMVVSQNMGSATITYEFLWIHIRSVDRYTGHVKSITNYNNGSKPIERMESFNGKLL
ncbi:hypothetical protein ACFSKL_05640 [Belliella marina]|uniref:Salivary secreted peptide n=1 Tax=Belliella marina TaxID=1644146 RepID=A0ABW4VHW5_9BACT